jgi:hypothetical protein
MDINEQSFARIQQCLEQISTPIVCRIAYEHMINRHETTKQKIAFYDFLKDFFNIIIVERNNIFDYAMCYGIRKQTDRPPEKQCNNVHSVRERKQLYADKAFTVDTNAVIYSSNLYVDYIDFVDTYFPSETRIEYEDLSLDIDNILQEIAPSSMTIKQKYGLSIAEYTACGYLSSIDSSNGYVQQVATLVDKLSAKINLLCEQKILLDPIPIKSTTTADKMNKVVNFDECVAAYNKWKENIDVD